MCGIAGIIGVVEKEVREHSVRLMNAAILHRGPDAEGWYSDDTATLAMRRLSIIDLAHGQQPKYSVSGRYLIFFNGEIYNYRELRQDLETKGIYCATNSDTEVIVNLYEVYQRDMFTMLRGMFAFCIYDLQTKAYTWARDPFGEKPLYYCLLEKGMVFSSEIKSLLQCVEVPRKLNHDALPYYLKVSYVPEPYTLLKDVKTLPPGHYMVYDMGHLSISSYRNVSYQVNDSIQSLDEAVEKVRPIFRQAVQRQLLSEVPLGAFLSGGIDSSAVVAQMQELSGTPVKTFNVKFEESAYDESPIAREVAHYLGTDHHELVIANADFSEEIFWEIIDHVGTPFPDSSAIPTWFICKEIKKHVTVALSGDGGDELFGGYPVFDWYSNIRKLGRYTPSFFSSAMAGAFNKLKQAPVFDKLELLRKLEKGISLAAVSEKKLPLEIHEMFSDSMIGKLTRQSVLNYEAMESYPTEYETWTDLRKIMYFRLRYNLPLDMLIKVDRMSMANSLEVRAPFLDADLFDLSTQLPDRFLRKSGQGKLVIRELMKDKLPSSVFEHPKSGFSIPLHKYQNKAFQQLSQELLVEKSPFTEWFDKDVLTYVRNNGLSLSVGNAQSSVYKSSHQLWSLLQLAGWMKRFNIEV